MSAAPIPALAPCFTGTLAPYAGLMSLTGGEADLPGRTLLDADGAQAVIARYAQATYPGADRRAVVSMWTQWYFGTLIVPAAAAILHLDRDLPLGLDEVSLALHPDGRPETVVLAHAGAPYAPDGAGRFERLVFAHVDPLVRHFAATFGVSRRLLWTNAAVILGWTLTQVEETGGACCDALAECRALLDGRTAPCGRANPLCAVLCPAAQASDPARRRVCCLRYRLPGVPCCGEICPLGEAQRNADATAGTA